MSEQRYSIISEVHQKSWILDCPVEISNGLLLFDTISKNIVLQLKLRNVSRKELRQVDILIKRLDLAGDVIHDTKELIPFTYTDLQVPSKANFGDRQPIILGQNATRQVEIGFQKVVYGDGEVWRNDSKRGEVTPVLADMKTQLGENLLAQYNREFQQEHRNQQNEIIDHNIFPEVHQDYWLCACGHPNLINQSDCLRCGTSRKWLFDTIQVNHLTENLHQYELDERTRQEKATLAEIERQRALNEQKLLNEKRQAEDAKLQKAKAKRKRLSIIIAMSVVAVLAVFVFMLTSVIIPNQKYNKAKKYEESGDLEAALELYESLDKPDDVFRVAGLFEETGNLMLAYEIYYDQNRIGDIFRIADKYYTEKNYTAANEILMKSSSVLKIQEKLKPSNKVNTYKSEYLVVLNDGTVKYGYDPKYVHYSYSSFLTWKEIVQVQLEEYIALGLKSDGTVLIAYPQNVPPGTQESLKHIDIRNWSDIVYIDVTDYNVFGLKSDGTVLVTGEGANLFKEVTSWTDIKSIACSKYHDYILGLKKSGKVVLDIKESVKVWERKYEDVRSWSNIKSIYAKADYAIGIRSDGKVLFSDRIANYDYEYDVSRWEDIVDLHCGSKYIAGLKNNGKLIVAYDGDYGKKGAEQYFGDLGDIDTEISGVVDLGDYIIILADGKIHQIPDQYRLWD